MSDQERQVDDGAAIATTQETTPFYSYKHTDGKDYNFKSPQELSDHFKNSVFMQSDYTKKTTELKKEREMHEAERLKWAEEYKDFQSKKKQIDEMDTFLKKNPHISNQLASYLKSPQGLQSNTQEYLDSQLKKYSEETNKQLEEIKAYRQQQEDEKTREALFNEKGQKYKDFNKEEILSEISRLQGLDQSQGLSEFVDLIYHAQKGRKTPEEIENRILGNLQKKQATHTPLSPGGKAPDVKTSVKSIFEAANKRKRELGVED